MFLHPHHGVTPLDRRQMPFWWETPSGEKVFVWLGEHYNIGNVMGLCPRAHLTHGLKDEWVPGFNVDDGGMISRLRLPRYLRQLELDGYPQSIVPMAISGTTSDNAPPNGEIARFARAWNERHGDTIKLEMTTASRFANLARENFTGVPTYRGDWPDWWSDGFVSQSDEVRLCRQAQRDYARAHSLAGHHGLEIPDALRDQVEESIALYTEHTFGHADSILSPWDSAVKMVAGMKRVHALRAVEASEEILDELEGRLGAEPLSPDRPFVFRVVNALDRPVRDCVRLYLEGPDFANRNLACVIRDLSTGEVLPSQNIEAPRGIAWGVWLELAPFETRDLAMEEGLLTLSRSERNFTDFIYHGLTQLSDVVGAEGPPSLDAGKTALESPFVRITWEVGGEIASWVDKLSGTDLLDPSRHHGAFTPVYDRTPVEPANNAMAQMVARGRIGRNRKGPGALISQGRIKSVEPLSAGPIFSAVQINYEVTGCSMFRLILVAWKDAPRVEATLQIHKDSVWDPENLYVALPFTTGQPETLWLDKPGAAVRPVIDQLPGSLTDFYTMQSGFALSSDANGLAIGCPDAPLLQLGDLVHGRRLLMGAPGLSERPIRPYGWLMSNYWETNFEATIGGFHEFRYRVEWGMHLASASDALACCGILNTGLSAFRTSAR